MHSRYRCIIMTSPLENLSLEEIIQELIKNETGKHDTWTPHERELIEREYLRRYQNNEKSVQNPLSSLEKNPLLTLEEVKDLIHKIEALPITENQKRVLYWHRRNKKLDGQDRTVLSRIRAKLEQTKDMIKLHAILKTDYTEFDEDDWLLHIRSLSKSERQDFYDYWRWHNLSDNSEEKYQAIENGMAAAFRYEYEAWLSSRGKSENTLNVVSSTRRD